MADDKTMDSTPTFHSNIVTLSYVGDQVIMELREYVLSHAEMSEKGGSVSATDLSDVYRVRPSARVVLTYAAARYIHEWLSANLATVDKNRKAT